MRVLTLSNAISSLIYVNHSRSWVVSDDISNIREVPYDPMIIKYALDDFNDDAVATFAKKASFLQYVLYSILISY